MYARMGGTGGNGFSAFSGDAGGVGGKELVCVVLMPRRSSSASTLLLLLAVPPVAESRFSLSEAVGKLSFAAKPSCQVALAHQPTTSSLMLSSFGLRFTKSRIQRGKR